MKYLLLLMLAAPSYADFNGEIETPTFVWRIGLPSFSRPSRPIEQGGGWHINPPDPNIKPPFTPFGKAVYVAGNASPAVKDFLTHSVFMGDSITHVWDLNTYFGQPMINKGIGGQRTDQMLARFNRDVLSLNPRGVFILGGINDIAQFYPVTSAEKNISTMVQRADAIHALVFVGTLIPAVPANNHQNLNMPMEVNQFNAWLKGYCNGTNCTVINYNKAAGGPGFQFKYHVDYVHPNNIAYRGMSRMVLHAVSRKLGTNSGHHCSHYRH